MFFQENGISKTKNNKAKTLLGGITLAGVIFSSLFISSLPSSVPVKAAGEVTIDFYHDVYGYPVNVASSFDNNIDLCNI